MVLNAKEKESLLKGEIERERELEDVSVLYVLLSVFLILVVTFWHAFVQSSSKTYKVVSFNTIQWRIGQKGVHF